MVSSFINKLSTTERVIQIHKLQRKLPSASWLYGKAMCTRKGKEAVSLPRSQEPMTLMALTPLRSPEGVQLGLIHQSLKQRPPGSGGGDWAMLVSQQKAAEQ